MATFGTTTQRLTYQRPTGVQPVSALATIPGTLAPPPPAPGVSTVRPPTTNTTTPQILPPPPGVLPPPIPTPVNTGTNQLTNNNTSQNAPPPSALPPPPGITAPGVIPQGHYGTAPLTPAIPPMPPNPFTEDGGALTEFGPGNDLRGTQINPYTGERLAGVQGDTDILFRSLAGAPNLSEAAAEKFRLLGEQSAEQRTRGIRDIGQAAARLGRLGSGMVTTDLGNLEDTLRTREEQARRGLASDLAFSEGNERRANLGAAQGFESQLYGQGAGARTEARTERGFQEDQARRAQDQEILRRQLEAAYELQRRQLALQGAGLYGSQAGASQQAAADLLGGSF